MEDSCWKEIKHPHLHHTYLEWQDSMNFSCQEIRVITHHFTSHILSLLSKLEDLCNEDKWKKQLTFKSLVIMYFSYRMFIFSSFQHSKKALVYTNVLLLCLNHPHTLTPHLIHYTKYVYVITGTYTE